MQRVFRDKSLHSEPRFRSSLHQSVLDNYDEAQKLGKWNLEYFLHGYDFPLQPLSVLRVGQDCDLPWYVSIYLDGVVT